MGAPGKAFFVSAARQAQGFEGWMRVRDILASPKSGASAGTNVKVVERAVKPFGRAGVALERWDRYEALDVKPVGGEGDARHFTDEIPEEKGGGEKRKKGEVQIR